MRRRKSWATWRRDLRKRLDAGQDVSVDLQIGAALVDEAAARATEAGAREDARALESWAGALRGDTSTTSSLQCLHLGGDPDGLSVVGVVEGLDAKGIARKKQAAAGHVPDGEGVHAA